MTLTPIDILIYYGTWLLPSATFTYIILREKLKWGRWKSYIISSVFAGTLMFPVESYIFSHL
jgi:hypothetical protein